MDTLVDHYRIREAEERLRADAAGSPEARAAHLELAQLFATRADMLARELEPPGSPPAAA